MGQILHGCARTTEAVRRTIQHRQESLSVLARRYGINPKTVAKRRQRTTVQNAPMGAQASSVNGAEQGGRSRLRRFSATHAASSR